MIPLDPDSSLQATRVIKAPREKVYDAFIVPELRKQWWASKPGYSCTICEIDARVGGDYRINMLTTEGEFFAARTFQELVRPEKQVFTWSWPTGEVKESLVTLLFKAIDDHTTELTLIHEKLSSAEYRDRTRKAGPVAWPRWPVLLRVEVMRYRSGTWRESSGTR
jgi:uncharacterized protein YndB with AHSA1/START domain